MTYILYIIVSLLIIPVAIYAIVMQVKVSTTFRDYSKQLSKKNMTAEEVAKKMLESENITNVKIIKGSGHLTDYYHPKKKYIALSSKVYGSTSIASIGVAAHECGHAIQHEKGYKPAKIRNFFVPFVNIYTWAFVPLIILGVIFSILGMYIGSIFLFIALGLFFITTLFYLVTLPVEFDASKRALKKLQELDILDEQELRNAKRVLSVAAQTYVASFMISLLNFLRFVLWALMSTKRN